MILSGTQPANHHRLPPARDCADQPRNRVFERHTYPGEMGRLMAFPAAQSPDLADGNHQPGVTSERPSPAEVFSIAGILPPSSSAGHDMEPVQEAWHLSSITIAADTRTSVPLQLAYRSAEDVAALIRPADSARWSPTCREWRCTCGAGRPCPRRAGPCVYPRQHLAAPGRVWPGRLVLLHVAHEDRLAAAMSRMTPKPPGGVGGNIGTAARRGRGTSRPTYRPALAAGADRRWSWLRPLHHAYLER
jgi:hypothetical protein